MKMTDIPRCNRPREKMMKYGTPDKLSNFELLAIIIGSGKRGENALELSKKILKKFPNDSLKEIKLCHLNKTKGIGKSKACQIIAGLELGRRLFMGKKSVFLMKPEDVWQELRDIRNNKKEYFIIFYLDTKNQIIKKELISVGTINTAIVHPREVFEPAISNFASQIIISHNHPSGDAQPSDEDIKITKRLLAAADILGIEIIDHIIVTVSNFFSFKKEGLI